MKGLSQNVRAVSLYRDMSGSWLVPSANSQHTNTTTYRSRCLAYFKSNSSGLSIIVTVMTDDNDDADDVAYAEAEGLIAEESSPSSTI